MILFLDDDPKRAALAYHRMKPEDRANTIWCQTAEETIITLKDYKYVLTKVLLDHDLGDEEFFSNIRREDCGMEVVRFLEKEAKDKYSFEPYKKMKFIIHTWNAYAGPKMVERLKAIGLDVEYKPFGL